MSDQFELGIFAAMDATAQTEAEARHVESMAGCWPEWDGNDGIKVGTRIEVGTCVVPLAERQEVPTGIPDEDGKRSSFPYAYCAPCYIAEVVSDREWIAVIDYPETMKETAAWVYEHNGIRLRLGICDIWPPVSILIAARRAEYEEENLEAAKINVDLSPQLSLQ